MEVHRGVRLQVRIPGEAVPKGRPRFARMGKFVRTITPERTVVFENKVAFMASEAVREFEAEQRRLGQSERVFPTDETVRMTVTAGRALPESLSQVRVAMALSGEIHPTGRVDVDNLLKAIMDGLQGIVYKNDNLVVDVHVVKVFMEQPETVVEIELLPEPIVVREPSVAAKLAGGKAALKEVAASRGHTLSRFKTVVDTQDAKAASVSCKTCKRSALVEASAGLASASVTGSLEQEACAS